MQGSESTVISSTLRLQWDSWNKLNSKSIYRHASPTGRSATPAQTSTGRDSWEARLRRRSRAMRTSRLTIKSTNNCCRKPWWTKITRMNRCWESLVGRSIKMSAERHNRWRPMSSRSTGYNGWRLGWTSSRRGVKGKRPTGGEAELSQAAIARATTSVLLISHSESPTTHPRRDPRRRRSKLPF